MKVNIENKVVGILDEDNVLMGLEVGWIVLWYGVL